ncbi:MAG: hypothetical protein L0Z50_33340 [Verrucomicrobiales bacterium]|nr:hypothetical protein [Verrucomicrobiales bacterium]
MEEFDILVAKTLAGEASNDETLRLNNLLAESAELRAEFAELEATWRSLRDVGPLAEALDAPPVVVPPARLRSFQTAVAREFGRVPSPTQPAKKLAEGQKTQVTGLYTWWSDLTGRAFGRLAFALLVVAAICLGLFAVTRSSFRPLKSAGASSTVAFLVVHQGAPEVRRAGETIQVRTTLSLRSDDFISLPEGARVSLIAPDATAQLEGPIIDSVTKLVGSQPFSRGHAQPAPVTPLASSYTNLVLAALFKPVDAIPTTDLLATTRSSKSIPLYSPVGSTARLRPVVLWKAEPGKTYDLSISDEFNATAPPWRLNSTVPPVVFDDEPEWRGRPLSADNLYRLRITESGRLLTTTEVTFRTMANQETIEAIAPAARLLRAQEILLRDPSCIGDALADLLTLPAEFSNCELALRLKLVAFGRLGYAEDFHEVLAQLRGLK